MPTTLGDILVACPACGASLRVTLEPVPSDEPLTLRFEGSFTTDARKHLATHTEDS